jgi:uridylate kinase
VTQRPVVVSIGGSVIAPDEVQAEPVAELANTLDEEVQAPMAIVVGGGAAARDYIGASRELGLDEAGLDEVGIAITRANAWLMIAALGTSAYPEPAEDFREAINGLQDYSRVCMGGTHPGHTTDAVAAMLAERLSADRLVVATNVDGVYDADPAEDPKAQRLERIDHDELVRLAGRAREAGSTAIVDPLATQILRRSRMPAAVVDGNEPANVARALTGGEFSGTRIAAE